MPRDPARVAETRPWLVKAARDLQTADVVLHVDPPLLEDVLFHCQQAVEKGLKGFLTWHDLPFRKTHSIEEIGEQCLQIEHGLRSVIDPAVPLTEYAWKFRYPGDAAEPSLQEARDALAVARELYEAILAGLPEETHP